MTIETIGRKAIGYGQRAIRGVAIAGILALTLSACETTQEAGNTVGGWGKGAANWTSRQYNAVAGSDEKAGGSQSSGSQGQATKAAYSPADYKANGIATWYSKKSHGRRASSGEKINNNALTAAHRTLPMGTKVRVTNLSNRRSIVVTINDNRIRNKNRIIQLSRRAAKNLGVLGKKARRRRVRVDSL